MRPQSQSKNDSCVRYSALRHLFAAACFNPTRLVAMLTLYCDASGKEQDSHLVVAGFVAPAEDWLSFETEWGQVLQRYKLKYFHMREFAHSRGQFKDWKGKEKQRRELLNRLITVLVRRAKCWMGACLLRETYQNVDRDWELHEYLHPYPLCAWLCIGLTDTWRKAQNLLPD